MRDHSMALSPFCLVLQCCSIHTPTEIYWISLKLAVVTVTSCFKVSLLLVGPPVQRRVLLSASHCCCQLDASHNAQIRHYTHAPCT